jgi:hypothetical protein
MRSRHKTGRRAKKTAPPKVKWTGAAGPLEPVAEVQTRPLPASSIMPPGVLSSAVAVDLGSTKKKPVNARRSTGPGPKKHLAMRSQRSASGRAGRRGWRRPPPGNGTARLEEAVSALRETLQEWTRARVPHYWAMSTGNQGVALMRLAERRGDTEMAIQAFRQIEAAFTTLRDGGDAHSTAMFEAELPKAQALVRKLATR